MSTVTVSMVISYHIISYHIVDLERQNRLKVGTNKPKLKGKMQPDDDARKRLLEKSHFKSAAKGVFRLGRCNIFPVWIHLLPPAQDVAFQEVFSGHHQEYIPAWFSHESTYLAPLQACQHSSLERRKRFFQAQREIIFSTEQRPTTTQNTLGEIKYF